jgi:hypothetical protein
MNLGDKILLDPSAICFTNWKESTLGRFAEEFTRQFHSLAREVVDESFRLLNSK